MVKKKFSSKEDVEENLAVMGPLVDFLNPIKKNPVFKEAVLA